MEIEVGELDGLVRKVSVTIPKEHIEKHFNAAMKRIQAKSRIKGYRPGKVPLRRLEAEYGASAWNEAFQRSIDDAVNQTLSSDDLGAVVHLGAVAPDAKWRPRRDLKITFDAEYFPEIEIDSYAVEVPFKKVSIDEAAVDAAIVLLQNEHAELKPVEEERAVVEGDIVTITYHGRGSEAAASVHAHDQDIEVGGEGVPESLSKMLIGRSVGDNFTDELELPEDFGNAELAGKSIDLEVDVIALAEKRLPELDDEFAKDLERGETFEELKADVRRELEERDQRINEDRAKSFMLRALEERYPAPMPPGFIAAEARSSVERQFREYMGPDADLSGFQQVLDSTANSMLKDVESRVRQGRLLNAIRLHGQIEASDEEFEAELERIAAANGMPVARIKGELQRPGSNTTLDDLRNQVAIQKTIDEIWSKATISEVDEWPDEGPAEDAEGAADADAAGAADAAAEPAGDDS